MTIEGKQIFESIDKDNWILSIKLQKFHERAFV